jgi:hypothetical protein
MGIWGTNNTENEGIFRDVVVWYPTAKAYGIASKKTIIFIPI